MISRCPYYNGYNDPEKFCTASMHMCCFSSYQPQAKKQGPRCLQPRKPRGYVLTCVNEWLHINPVCPDEHLNRHLLPQFSRLQELLAKIIRAVTSFLDTPTKMDLQNLPAEIFIKIIEQLVITIGPFRAVRIRLVNSKLYCNIYAPANRPLTFSLEYFDTAIVEALTTTEVIDFDDPHICPSLWLLPCPLKARALLAWSKRNETNARKDESLSFMADVLDILDELIGTAASEDELEQRHLMIAEAVAFQYFGGGRKAELIGHVSTDALSFQKHSLLCGAIVLGNLPLVQNLLTDTADIDVNAENSLFGLPLHLAGSWGHITIVQYLIASGADPRKLSHDQEYYNETFEHIPNHYHQPHNPSGSVLRAAAISGHDAVVQLLLDLPPEQRIPATDAEHLHAIVAAAQGGHLGCIELIVRDTGKPLAELPSSLHKHMLWEAARYGRPGVMRLLLEDPRINLDVDVQKQGRCRHGSALNLASARGNLQTVKLLLERYGADPALMPCGPNVEIPYDTAARAGHREVLEVLLDAVNSEDSRLHAFRSAARGAQVGILRWLMERYGHDIARRKVPRRTTWDDNDEVGKVALWYAIVQPAPGVLTFLVREAGVPLNEGVGPCFVDTLPMVIAKTCSSRWVADLMLRLGAEDVAADEEEFRMNCRWENRESATGLNNFLTTVRGVQVSTRTWQWA